MPDILHKVGIDARPEKVFEALTTMEGISSWWDSRGVTGDAQEGKVFNLTWGNFKVIEAKPYELVKWKVIQGPEEWLNTEIIFGLTWKKEQTMVLFKHAGWPPPGDLMHHCSTKWAVFLLSLKDYVEKGKGDPAPFDTQIFIGERVKR